MDWTRRFQGFFAALLFVCLAGVCQGAAPVKADDPAVDPLETKWGVRVESVRLSAAGHMIDFRYRVLDPEKAAPLFVRETKPYLYHPKTDKSFTVHSPAKLGPMRNSDSPKADRIYFIFFGDTGKLVEVGDTINVVIGEFEVTGLTVQ